MLIRNARMPALATRFPVSPAFMATSPVVLATMGNKFPKRCVPP